MMRLTKREKSLAVMLGTFLVLWVIFAAVISPAFERIKTLNRVIPDKQAELNQLVAKSSEYITLRDSLGDLQSRIDSQPEDLRLLPYLESLVKQCGLSERVESMNQRVAKLQNDYYETVVEIKLQQLTLRQLVDLLEKAENSDAVAKTKTLFITRNPTNNNLLDSRVEIHSAALNTDPTAGT